MAVYGWQGGPSLAFVAYPEAVLRMDFPPIWSFLFFFMLINLALSSICGGVQTFLAFILDEKPSLQKYVSQPWDWNITRLL
jgi:SNF family Na+-dependent transporter